MQSLPHLFIRFFNDSMRNYLLLFFSIIISLFSVEIFIRSINIPFLLELHDRDTTKFITEFGYFNPNSGINQPNPKKSLQYHFYPPHLRDTQINKKAKHILVLGDSFTFGLHLPWESTYVYQLQLNIDNYFGKNKYQLLNAATPGWGTIHYLTYLEHYGEETSPKFVLIFLNSDDIGRSINQSIVQVNTANRPVANQKIDSIHQLLLSFKKNLFRSWLFNHLELIQFLYFECLSLFNSYRGDPALLPPMQPDLDFRNDIVVGYAETLFLRINEWCNLHHAKLLIITTGFNALYPDNINDPTKSFLSKADKFFSKNNIIYYDIAS